MIQIRKLDSTDSDFKARLSTVLAFEASEDEAIDRAAAQILADVKTRGDAAVLADTPWGGIGLSVCYDVRFPQLYRSLAQAGAFAFTAPSAFTVPTGQAHWHVLLRARAIENGAFVIAPAQGGSHDNGRKTYGHSLIVGPWGEVLAEAGTDPGVIHAEIDPARSAAARAKLPNLRHARDFAKP